MQYTIRQIPKVVDQALRAKARAERKSLNEAVIDALQSGLGVSVDRNKKRDLSGLAGSLSADDAKAITEAVKAMDSADLHSQKATRR
jgi:hypothetical protein